MEMLPNYSRNALVLGFSGSARKDDEHTNPTAHIATAVHNTRIQTRYIEGHVIPSSISLRQRAEVVRNVMHNRLRHIVIHFGVANVPGFVIETRGQNIIDTVQYPAHQDGLIVEEPIIPEAPRFYKNTSHKLGWIAAQMQQEDFATTLGEDAGTLGCNASLVSMLHHRLDYPVLFVHTPMTPTYARNAQLQPDAEVHTRPLDWIIEGARFLIDVSLRDINYTRRMSDWSRSDTCGQFPVKAW